MQFIYQGKANEERLSELLTVSKNLEIKALATVININQCDKKFTQQITLTRHILSMHEGVKYKENSRRHTQAMVLKFFWRKNLIYKITDVNKVAA